MMMVSGVRGIAKHRSFRALSRRNVNSYIPLLASVLLLLIVSRCSAFRSLHGTRGCSSSRKNFGVVHYDRLVRRLQAESSSSSTSSSSESKSLRRSKSTKNPTPKFITLADLSQQVLSNPAKFKVVGDVDKTRKASKTKSSSYKRTRQRVSNPKQTYLYKAQREKLLQNQSNETVASSSGTAAANKDEAQSSYAQAARELAQELGMVVSSQHCHPDICAQPDLIGRIPITSDASGDNGLTAGGQATEPFSARYAYILNKPAGWAILGNAGTGGSSNNRNNPDASGSPVDNSMSNRIKKITIIDDEDGSADVLEYNELDVMALLTPEELEDYLVEEDLSPDEVTVQLRTQEEEEEDDDIDVNDDSSDDDINEEMDPIRRANLQRIAARLNDSTTSNKAQFANVPRPSIVAWLKEYCESRQQPIRGGTYWTAVAGATHVDDSGLIVLVPRHKVDQIQIKDSTFVAIVGTGGSLAKIPKQHQSSNLGSLEYTLLSRLRKGRLDDSVQAVQIHSTNPELTSCSSVVPACQEKFQQGIRGDPEANPLDRRAPRRLLHCQSLTVSSSFSLAHKFERKTLPLDMVVLVERATHTTGQKLFTSGSFLGRPSYAVRNSTSTSAYREINGAADGYPGWIVDRYNKWLLVQHDPKTMASLGPLPSIHDGNTAGVYILEQSSPDRSTDGSMKPRLLEGQAAPERFPVTENGVTYLVSLQDMSTGMFLDQRPHRAWLAQHCCPETQVLNCFAHAGAFSVAAATAGASTVSIDLSRKWLERLPDQLRANGIDFDERHDAIYGDCFDWLARLSKRGEKYDIVILDPPSTSVGGLKKKRWSIKNDMDELVSLAAGLVKKGGVLWTTTNSASVPPIQFARLCKKGLDNSGVIDYKLERVQPMPGDFPSIGPQPVKNYVWRILR